MTLKRMVPLRAKPRSKGNRCACGCGAEIPELSKQGKPQRFAHGHNGRIPLNELIRKEDRGYATPCWIWQGGTTADGRYGRTKFDGRMQPAHRVFFLVTGGSVPCGHEMDHLCRVTLCVNPTHLEAVTPIENKQRAGKLTAADAEYLRSIRDSLMAAAEPKRDGTPRKRVPHGLRVREKLAKDFGVTPDQIKHIWAGRTWAN